MIDEADFKIRVHSTTEIDQWHTISIQTDIKKVSCDCRGFITHGRCKHIKFYKSLINALIHKT